MEPKITVARWQSIHGSAREHLVLRENDESIVAESVYISAGGNGGFAVHYKLVLDPDWSVRELHSQVVGARHNLHLRRDASGRWFDQDGELPHLSKAIDVDLSISPFTNTLPIRRLKLSPGQSADLIVAYVGFPSNAVTADPQHYTCIEPGQFRFNSVDTDFQAIIEVDAEGLVIDYPDMFTRIV